MDQTQEVLTRIENVKTEILQDLFTMGISIWVEGERQDPSQFSFGQIAELAREGKQIVSYRRVGNREHIERLDVDSLLQASEGHTMSKLDWVTMPDNRFFNAAALASTT